MSTVPRLRVSWSGWFRSVMAITNNFAYSTMCGSIFSHEARRFVTQNNVFYRQTLLAKCFTAITIKKNKSILSPLPVHIFIRKRMTLALFY